MKPLTVQQAAAAIGMHPRTIRRWADAGKLPCYRIGRRGDRRFAVADIDLLRGQAIAAEPRVALYLRVSGRGDQLSSLDTQLRELTDALSTGSEVISVFKDVGSGMNENRKGLKRAIEAAKLNKFDELHVTHPDRLTRFGDQTLRELFMAHGVLVKALYETDEATPEQELMADFMALIASFSGRLYGQRSAATKKRLLERVQ